jgi:hypothetical protein
MPRGRSNRDTATLQMALVGYEVEKQKIENKMRELQAMLKGKSSPAASGGTPSAAPRRKRRLSADARKRIAAAQKKRWAEHRKRMAQAG